MGPQRGAMPEVGFTDEFWTLSCPTGQDLSCPIGQIDLLLNVVLPGKAEQSTCPKCSNP